MPDSLTEIDPETSRYFAKMEARVKLLRSRKEILFRRLQNAFDNAKLFKNDGSETDKKAKKAFQISCVSLDDTKVQFEQVLDEINMILIELSQEPNFSDLNSFDELFCHVKEILFSLQNDEGRISTPRPDNLNATLNNTLPTLAKPVLPPLEIPKFDGNELNWLFFYRNFKSVIIDNKELTNDDKVRFLSGALQGKALLLVSGINPTGENFQLMWDTLYNRYADPRVLAINYLNKIIHYRPQTKESISTIEDFMQNFISQAQAFLNLNLTDPTNLLLYHLAASRLPATTLRQFELSISVNATQNKIIPGFKELVNFLHGYVKVLAHSSSTSSSSDNKLGSIASQQQSWRYTPSPRTAPSPRFPPSSRFAYSSRFAHSPRSPNVSHSFLTNHTFDNNKKCPVCSKCTHPVYMCDVFKALTIHDRNTTVKKHKLCLNCLSYFHSSKDCRSMKSCQSCKSKHHTLLCANNSATGSDYGISATDRGTSSVSVVAASMPGSRSTTSTISTVLLSTALVTVYDVRHKPRLCRALLDSASQSNFITQSLCDKLGLTMRPVITNIQGIGASMNQVKNESVIKFASRFDNSTKYELKVLIMNKITNSLPSCDIPLNYLTHLQGLPLADETYHVPGSVDLLIGASLFASLLESGKVTGPPNTPIALQTTLGYVVTGPVGASPQLTPPAQVYFLQAYQNTVSQPLDKLVARMWELEDLPHTNIVSSEEEECEKIFNVSTKRTSQGRYSVDLPFSLDPSLLGSSKDIALRRFFSLEKRLESDSALRSEYNKFMEDYVLQGHMVLSENNIDDDDDGCYLPHHCVLKPDSTSTKLRVVWDASCSTSSGYSLNSVLHTGPKLQQDLSLLLINFRLYAITMTADVRQMYRQIMINEHHRKYQKIFWRSSTKDKISIYVLNTVTFGVKPSPYLALRVLREHAKRSRNNYPLAAPIIEESFYVDDLCHSIPTVDVAIEVHRQLSCMLRDGGFELVKWNSNSADFLNTIAPDIRLNQNIDFDPSDTAKILGLQYNPSRDCFSFNVIDVRKECTKRNVLSTFARIFDPIGFLAPVTVYLKILIKDLWNAGVGWDEIPSSDQIISSWNILSSQLPLLSQFNIPRHIGLNSKEKIDLVGFADASSKAYGAVIYSRVELDNKQVLVSLLCSKTRVAPQKHTSIPRLELCAALLLSKLMHFTVASLSSKLNSNNIYTFSDSSCVLCWISSQPSRWKVFVANRVSQIQELLPNAKWLHVPGTSNPADSLSRGLSPKCFLSHPLWLTGPDWIVLDPECWPSSFPSSGGEETSEEKRQVLISTDIENHPFNQLVDHCSSYDSIIRIIAYLLRWKSYYKKIACPNYVTSEELDKAEILLLKYIQNKYFSEEIHALNNNNTLSLRFRKLHPFQNEHGLVVVGGRLAHSNLSYQQKHPVLLPKNSRLVKLLVYKFHATNFHTGPSTTLALLRQKYWIFNGRDVVRKCLSTCNLCFKHKPKSSYPLMGNLPKERVQECKPFLNTGCDFAGPFNIVFSKRRGVRTHKAYLCLFVCLATKAVHLELASDLSTPTFLNALKRFISRRGPVRKFFSDGATNFIGARNHLDKVYDLLLSSEYMKAFGEELAANRISWSQIVPSAPHMGGLWESNIKGAKSLLHKVIGSQILTYEELHTVLTQVEAILNSRPLCLLNSDPCDLRALTPADFLNQHTLDHFPSPDLQNTPLNRLTRYQMLEKMTQDFWKRWKYEYLNTLQSREKWNTPSNPVKVGTVVLIRKDNCPPLQWPLGIIEEVQPGKDGVIRVVVVRSRGHRYSRPVVKLCPLPTQ